MNAVDRKIIWGQDPELSQAGNNLSNYFGFKGDRKILPIRCHITFLYRLFIIFLSGGNLLREELFIYLFDERQN
jgi:hypothetical protein